MSCLTDLEIIGFAEGTLSAIARHDVELHLDTCPSCFDLLAAWVQSSAPMDSLALEQAGAPGPLLADGLHRYVPGPELARGGMGKILSAEDRLLGRTVALKLLRRSSTGLSRRFMLEQRITARLQHPAIVPIYDAGVLDDGEPFFAMRLVRGESLDRHAERATSLEERLRLLPAVLGVVDAVAYAHGEGVVHRDLKPQNVLVGPFGEVVVLDWGLARESSGETDHGEAEDTIPGGHDDGSLTRDGDRLGTVAYMAPEQAAGHTADARSDVYGLAAILYHVLTGKPPHAGRTTSLSTKAVLHVPPPLAIVAPEVPADLVAIVARGMAQDPAARYASAQELAEDLKRWQAGRMVLAHRYSSRDLVRRFVRRHRASLLATTTALVILTTLGVLGVQRILAERSHALAEGARADAQRVAAEKLVGFILRDLRPRMERLGRLDALGDVARAVLEYQDGAPPAEDPETWLMHAEAAMLVGDVAFSSGDLETAEDAYDRSRDAAAKAGSTEGADVARSGALRSMGNLLTQRRELEAAAALYEECIALAGAAPSQALLLQALWCQVGLAGVKFERGESSAARALLEERLPEAVALVQQAGGPGGEAGALLMTFHMYLWSVLYRLEVYDRAYEVAQVFVDLALARIAARPDDTRARYRLAIARSMLGDASASLGDPAAAEAHNREALVELRALTERDPSNLGWLHTMGAVAESMGTLAEKRGDDEAALSWYRESADVSAHVVALAPDAEGYQLQQAQSKIQLVEVLKRMERFDAARVELEQALEILDRSQAEGAGRINLLAMALRWKAELDVREHQTAPALAALRRASELLASALETDDQPRLRIDRVDILADLAELEPPSQATRILDEAQALLEPLLRADPDDPELRERATRLEEIRLDAAAPGPRKGLPDHPPKPVSPDQ